MSFVLVTPPAAEPVSTVEAKSHLRVDISDDDTYIDTLVKAARQTAEDIQHRALITQTWKLVMDAFPSGAVIELPFPPLQSVTSIKYTDEDGGQSTFNAENYLVDTASEPGRVVLKSDASWPSDTLQAAAGVEITYVAGYGNAGTDVPETTRQAIFLMVGEWYENRENATQPRKAELPMGVMRLLWLNRAF